MIAADKESSCNQYHYILIDGEDPMDCNEDLLIIMVKFISCPQRILFSIPFELFVNQGLQGLLVKFITVYNCEVSADLSFKID